ncbi:MAG: ATP-dependent DNA helicase RecG [Candidatus Cryptobacteroides sp.]|nr:ATP-dependent DNA helicase RecG [Candidatus Cryptobacteroides sp.]
MAQPVDMDIQFLPGVGPKRAELLRKELNINTVGDLLRFWPFRYIDRCSFVRIADARADMAYIQIRAKVLSVELFSGNSLSSIDASDASKLKFNTIKRMKVMIGDESGQMETTYFKGIKWVWEKLKVGSEFIFFGKPSTFNNRVTMVHPEIDPVPADNASAPNGNGLVGVYSSTEKLRNSSISNKVMNNLMQAALNCGLKYVKESLPEYIMKEKGLVPIHFAIRNIHFPSDLRSLEQARRRLKFEELFYLQLSLLKQKFQRTKNSVGIRMPKVGEAFNLCYNALPFPLTGAQKRVITQIRDDLKSGHQMNRLLQGDVGSGKTMVAVLSALIAIGNGYQACIMAPTEVLAQQHYKNILKFLEPCQVRSALLTGSSKTAQRREVHDGLMDGSINLIVGTHALIEDNVVFHNLGLAIIDEQHRFGVEQRSKLWNKSSCGIPPHILVMTATPIPRTLAMTLWGDLDVSVIDELPPGRQPVKTIHITESQKPQLYSFMRDQIALGRQVFVVFPLINETEKLDYKSLEEGANEIMDTFRFPQYKTAVVHGKMQNDVKQLNMDAFAEGRANILVATSVIEVGVDVPNASVMVIESAERFGLSQLHQLRGRVGRGSEKSWCILMTKYNLSKESRHRIELMCKTENGFVLAEEDMKMRGPGDLEGTQQSGLPIDLSIASLATDGLLLEEARQCAAEVLERDPSLTKDENFVLREELRKDKYDIKDYSNIS